ncbi:MAG TPA: AI-2E family transporter [Thermoleophilaceae bacterium]|nr:AI-2E family transporter [Thermoleophilaceae bacterium]
MGRLRGAAGADLGAGLGVPRPALNPAVEWLQRRRGIRRRAAAAAVIYVGAIAALVGFAFLIIPPAVDQVRGLADATPHYVHDLTAGRGPLGFLQRDYHVVDRVRDALHGGGTAKLAGGAGTVVSITKGVLTAIVAVVTIAFMTFFMIVEGPTWADRFSACSPRRRSRAGEPWAGGSIRR